MEDDTGDLSQLMAFAEALGEAPLGGEEVWSLDDKLDGHFNIDSSDSVYETIPWKPASLVEGRFSNNFADIIRSIQGTDCGHSHETSDSPESPAVRNRTSLFASDDKTITLDVCGEMIDPRNACVVDHPGRHSHFKTWLQAGFISDDSRRISIKDESSKPSCWQDVPSENSRSASTTEGGILGGLIKTKTASDPPVSNLAGLLSLTVNSRDENSKEAIPESKTPKGTWKDRTFVVGKSVKVAMREAGLHRENVRDWCLWFNDLLCSLGLSDMRSVGQSSSNVMEADMDFSDNCLTDEALREIVNLLSAFKRLHVRTLRLASNSLSDAGLGYLAGLYHIRHLVVDDNVITRDGLLSFVVRNTAHRADVYEALLAQDVSDDSVLFPIFLSCEMNIINNGLDVVRQLNDNGITVCLQDSTGCDRYPHMCKVFGSKCGIHLSGLGSQKKF